MIGQISFRTAVSGGLRLATALDAATAGHGLDALGAGARAFVKRAPFVSRRSAPCAGTLRSPPAPRGRPRAVYFGSCVGHMFGPARGRFRRRADRRDALSTSRQGRLRRGYAEAAGQSGCGQPFESKGLKAKADRKAEEALVALIEASEAGRWPVFSDMSPCSRNLKAAAAGQSRSARYFRISARTHFA